jgi:hypothetical protein
VHYPGRQKLVLDVLADVSQLRKTSNCPPPTIDGSRHVVNRQSKARQVASAAGIDERLDDFALTAAFLRNAFGKRTVIVFLYIFDLHDDRLRVH